MKVYLAGNSSERDLVIDLANQLRPLNLNIISRWHTLDVAESEANTRLAWEDNIDRIAAADLLIFAAGQAVPQGALIEIGMALANRNRVAILSASLSAYHSWITHPAVFCFSTYKSLAEWINLGIELEAF